MKAPLLGAGGVRGWWVAESTLRPTTPSPSLTKEGNLPSVESPVVRASRPQWRERLAPARAGCPRHSGRDARAAAPADFHFIGWITSP